jgi:hypothetical protein
MSLKLEQKGSAEWLENLIQRSETAERERERERGCFTLSEN